MTNPLRGEVPLKSGDQTYTLVLSWNALCILEEATKLGGIEIMLMLGDTQGAKRAKVRFTLVRATLWAALAERHPGTSIEDAGRIAAEAGLEAVLTALANAMLAAFGGGKADEEGGDGPLAGKPTDGILKPS